MHTLAQAKDPGTSAADVAKSLKVLYLIWRDQTGGAKYHQKFEELRNEVLPGWVVPGSGS
jgi:hypothetical protein